MKKILTLLVVLVFTSSAIGEEAKTYAQWDTFRFTIDNKHAQTFTKNMRAHLKKYHQKSPLITKIYNVTYGPDANDLIWVMGPVSYSELDARPDDKGHDQDWAENINPYITSYKQSEIWRVMDGLVINNLDENSEMPTKYIARYLTGDTTTDADFKKELLNQVKATLEKTGKIGYWSVMSNQFLQGKLNGRHFMALSSLSSWADLDDDMEFPKHYESLYGKGSFKEFRAKYQKAFPNHWHEIISINKEMSGME